MAKRTKHPQRAAFNVLSSMHTHDFLDVGTANAIAAPFGVHPRPEQHRANTDDPKGLKNPRRRRGEVVEGVSVYRLSTQIADSLPDYPEGTEIGGFVSEEEGYRHYSTMLGRGSMARAAWAYIAYYLKQEGR